MKNQLSDIAGTALFCILFLIAMPGRGQLSPWNDYVDKTFVFEIGNREAEKLLRSDAGDTMIRKMLHTQVAQFGEKWENAPGQGHFIFARIRENRVDCQYVPVMPFKVFLYKEYGVLTLQVADAQGEIRRDAKVRIAKRWRLFNTPVAFDTESQTYRIDEWSEKRYRMLTVELDGFRAVFDLTKHLVSPGYGGGGLPYSPDFYSYMLTDKNRYKPGETIRFKSYTLTGSRRPLRKELEVWLQEGDGWRFRKISTFSPYNPGGYAGQLHLHDSLGLKLDKNYSMQLREPRGRVVARSSFRYEDYVLYDNTLELKLQDSVHYYPETNRLEIKARDANGLLLPDVRAEVAVLLRDVHHSHTEILSLRDTLLYERIDLENNGPTTLEIPASVFSEADGVYNVQVTIITPDGQRMSATEGALFFRSRRQVAAETRGDTLRFTYYETGKPVSIAAELLYGKAETGREVTLPYEERFDQATESYRFRIPGTDFEQVIPAGTIDPGFELEGGIRRDSFNIRLINPLQLDVSWYVYQGNSLIGKGSGKEMEIEFPETDLTKVHYVEVFYFMGDREFAYRRSFVPQTRFLTVETDLPERIFPGQTVEARISVSDHLGNPVRQTDLTAFAYNSLLDYTVPDLHYFGPQAQRREQRSSYSIDRKGYRFSIPLDYGFWRQRAGLDTLDYYRFAYPQGLFVERVPTPDGITQFAPYVMKRGAAVDIYVIEDNGEPVYLSWTQQPQGYSFPADPARKHTFTLRLHDRALVIDSLDLAEGHKTILSLDLDRLPEGVRTVKLDFKNTEGRFIFNPAESAHYSSRISTLPVRHKNEANYLTQKGRRYLIYHPLLNEYWRYGSPQHILAGPVPPGESRYWNDITYRHEGGFRYAFEDNVVYKYPENTLPKTLGFSSRSRIVTLGDFYLSPKVLEEKVRVIGWRDHYWHPSNIYIKRSGMSLNFRLPEPADSIGIANLLLFDRKNERMVYPDRYEKGSRDFSEIRPGEYDVILLYNDARHLRRDSVLLAPNAYTELDMTRLPLRPADSLSLKWLNTYASPGTIGVNTVRDSRTLTLYRRAARQYGNMVSGFVYDSEGEPLTGVSVILKGTQYGTLTDIDGFFEIDTDNNNQVLQLNYIGFIPLELQTSPGMLAHVILEEDAQMLEEVVVVAYGTSIRSSLTGSISGMGAHGSPPLAPPEEVQDDERSADTQAEERLYRELLTLNGLRSNFSDVAFWEPSLVTDRQGKAFFTVTFPDNITRWNAVVYAMNRRLQTGTGRQSIRSYKPLMAELRTPGFLVAGDNSTFTGNIRNYTSDETIRGHVVFMQQSDTLLRQPVEFVSSHPDRIPVTAPDADSLTATYLFTRDDGYADGEKRSIPVIPPGTKTAEGTLGFLREGERIDLAAGPNETVELIVTGNQLDVYLDATYYLSGYRYACNEQLASKLIGLLNLRLYDQYQGKRFRHDRDVNRIIRQLLDNRNGEKLWSWWGNSSGTSHWMSAHILRALKMAKDHGYTVNLNLTGLTDNYFDVARYRRPSPRDIEILHALSEWGVEQPYEPAVAYWETEIRRWEHTADSMARIRNRKPTVSYLNEKLLLWEIRQKQGLDFEADSVAKYLKADVVGAVYCDDGIERPWYYDALATTLTAYRLAGQDSTLRPHREAMRMYILGTKQYGWNTYRSATAVATVFPDLLARSSTRETPATLRLTGRENRTVTRFPYRTELAAGEVIGIEKQSGMPLIWSAYTMKRRTEAQTGEAFDIETRLTKEGRLTVGQIDTLVVTVRVKQKNAEHVMIEVPIPAGCDYASKTQSFRGPEVHREHLKEKTVIFCERMPEGEYTFRIALLPRFSGNYTVNPAKIELMYFPTVSSNNNLSQTQIE